MARPSKNNPNWAQKKQAREEATKNWKLQKFFDALKGWLNRDTAISYAGLKKRTVYERLKDDDNFRLKVEDAEEYRFAIVEDAKNKKIKEWFRPAIEKELKSKRATIYWDKIDVDQKTTHLWEIIVKLPE